MLEEKVVDILNQMEALTKQFAPDVVDAAMGVAQVNGIANLVTGFVLLILAFATYKISMYLYKFFKMKKKEDGYSSDWEVGYTLVAIIGSILCCFLIVAGFLCVLDTWSWVAIFNPKLALAKSIINLP